MIEDRELKITLRVVDVNGCEIVYAHMWQPLGPLRRLPLTLTTGITNHLRMDGARAEVTISDPRAGTGERG